MTAPTIKQWQQGTYGTPPGGGVAYTSTTGTISWITGFGPAAGNTLVMIVQGAGASGFVGPAGWTFLRSVDNGTNSGSIQIFTKTATASESSYSFTVQGYYPPYTVMLQEVTPCTVSLAGAAPSFTNSTTISTPTLPAYDATQCTRWLGIGWAQRGMAPSTPAGLTLLTSDTSAASYSSNANALYSAPANVAASYSFAFPSGPNFVYYGDIIYTAVVPPPTPKARVIWML